MKVSKVTAYTPLNFKNEKSNIRVLTEQEKALVKKAQEELEMIERQGKVAGTDAAWWRYEYNEALEELKKIANGILPEPDNGYRSLVREFHSFDDDGFI